MYFTVINHNITLAVFSVRANPCNLSATCRDGGTESGAVALAKDGGENPYITFLTLHNLKMEIFL